MYVKVNDAAAASILDRKKRGYKSKYLDRFTIINDKLHFEGKLLITAEKIPEWLAGRYRQLSVGRDKLYNTIKDEVAGISCNDVADFLKNNQTNQIHRPYRPAVHQPIITSRPLERIQCDLIDLNSIKGYNEQHRYVLTAVDHFTKYAWAISFKQKSGPVVFEALKNILTDHRPSILQSDRGSEFVYAPLGKWLEAQGIKHIMSLPYSPQSNGAIESFNKTLKGMIFRTITDTGNNDFVSKLRGIVHQYNNSWHSTIKMTPETALKGGRRLNVKIRRNIVALGDKLLTRGDHSLLRRGTWCRIAMQTLPDVRKDRMRKKYLQQWSDQLFRIVGISRSGTDPLYNLKDTNGNPTKKLYYRNELLPVDKDKLITPTSRTSIPVTSTTGTPVRSRVRK